jgi:hypothetical protein
MIISTNDLFIQLKAYLKTEGLNKEFLKIWSQRKKFLFIKPYYWKS